MSAPNIATLYDFESAYEDALRNYFANVAAGAFGQVVTPRTNIATEEWLQTPRLMIKAGVTGVGASGSGLQEDRANTAANVAGQYYSYYSLSVTLDLVTARENVSQNHGLLRGLVRQSMLEASAIITNTTVPYYQTVFVTPGQSVQFIVPENDEIQTQLTYNIDFQIPPASFP